jgi:hypothetical protein
MDSKRYLCSHLSIKQRGVTGALLNDVGWSPWRKWWRKRGFLKWRTALMSASPCLDIHPILIGTIENKSISVPVSFSIDSKKSKLLKQRL